MATKNLPLKTAYAFGTARGLQDEISEIRNLVIEWDLSYTSSLRKGYVVELFEKRGIWDEFKAENWPHGNTPNGETRRRRLLEIKKRYEYFLAGDGPEIAPGPENEDEEDDQQFAAESDLRDFLAKNLVCIEPGLRLYVSAHDGQGWGCR